MSRCVVGAIVVGATFAFLVMPLFVYAQAFNAERGVALGGYDVVSYHLDSEAVEGRRKFSVKWNDVRWYFSSKEHAALFEEDPERYAPQYGGYCAYAAANNSIAPVDPLAFSVVDDKLYLNFSNRISRRWNRDREKNISLADGYWPELQSSLVE